MWHSEKMTLDEAVTALTMGYEEEAHLYQAVRRLTRSQKRVLDTDGDLLEFCDLLGEKEDVLRIIAQIERKVEPAKTLVLAQDAQTWNGRERLAVLLERVTEIIDEIRMLEGSNAARLQGLAEPASCQSAGRSSRRLISAKSA